MKPPRFPEIDSLRGIAILCMVAFHFLFDYNFFVRPQFDLYSGLWFFLGRFAAFLFLLLVGISLSLRVHRRKLEGRKLFSDLFRRGAFIFGLGLLITLFTLLFFPGYPIWFGVLHLIGLSTIFAIPFLGKPKLSLLVGAIIVLLGLLFSFNVLMFPNILVLFPIDFPTFDYFPLFPWFGLVLIGVFLGNWLYPDGKPRFGFKTGSNRPWVRFLAWAGRNSLAIYFLHQPILVGLLLLAH